METFLLEEIKKCGVEHPARVLDFEDLASVKAEHIRDHYQASPFLAIGGYTLGKLLGFLHMVRATQALAQVSLFLWVFERLVAQMD